MIATITTFRPPLSQPGFRLFDGPLCDVADVSAGQIGVVGMPSDWTHSSRLGTRFGPESLRGPERRERQKVVWPHVPAKYGDRLGARSE